MKQDLIIFTKNMVPGKVKTRLAATIGDKEAFAVYEKLLAHTASITRNLPFNKSVYYSDHIPENDIWENSLFDKHLQEGGDLGERMANAFRTSFNADQHEVAIIGSDCPELHEDIILDAFLHLTGYDIVLGPAEDGGYYLLAMKQLYESLFEGISWSTSEVLTQTVAKCKELELSVFLLPTLRDIDTESDLLKTPI